VLCNPIHILCASPDAATAMNQGTKRFTETLLYHLTGEGRHILHLDDMLDPSLSISDQYH